MSARRIFMALALVLWLPACGGADVGPPAPDEAPAARITGQERGS